MFERHRVAAILVAAGTGSRFGGETPKQYLPLAGTSGYSPRRRSARAARSGYCSRLARPRDYRGTRAASLICRPSPGGATRQEACCAGLEALAPHAPEIVLVHDAARPFIPARHDRGAARGTCRRMTARSRPCPSRIRSSAAPTGGSRRPCRATGLFRAQTPQAFRFATLLGLHRAAAEGATDDAAILEAAGHVGRARRRPRGQHQADLHGGSRASRTRARRNG